MSDEEEMNAGGTTEDKRAGILAYLNATCEAALEDEDPLKPQGGSGRNTSA